MQDIVGILERAVMRAGSKRALARALRRSRQWLDVALAGKAKPGAEVCVRLANHERLNALDVLRAAGHEKLAGELAAAGFNASTQVTDDDRALLAAYHALPIDQQHHLRALLESVADVRSRRPIVAPAEGLRRRR